MSTNTTKTGAPLIKETMIMKNLIGMVMFLVASVASADSVVFNLGSYHDYEISESHAEYYGMNKHNETNFGLGYALDLNDNASAELGFYENSFKETTVYGYLSFELMENEFVTPRLDIGAANYGKYAIPFVRATFVIGKKSLPMSPEVGFITYDNRNLFTFALRYYFND